jgi:alanyl-tRNA synthetase
MAQSKYKFSTEEIRSKFLEFFKKNEHEILTGGRCKLTVIVNTILIKS